MFCWLSPVLHLLLYTGPGVMFGVPEDQLWTEDGGDAGRRGDLQRHHPTHTLFAAGWVQQGAVPCGDAGQVHAQQLLVRIKVKAVCLRWAGPVWQELLRWQGEMLMNVWMELNSFSAFDWQQVWKKNLIMRNSAEPEEKNVFHLLLFLFHCQHAGCESSSTLSNGEAIKGFCLISHVWFLAEFTALYYLEKYLGVLNSTLWEREIFHICSALKWGWMVETE